MIDFLGEEEKELLNIEITKKGSKYFIQMEVKSFDFKKEEVLDLIQHQFDRFIIKEDEDNENNNEYERF